MAEINQFGNTRGGPLVDTKLCHSFEAMLADAVDGTLTAEEQVSFDEHVASCASCREMLADAKRGSAWMGMLREQTPEPPAAMLERIFAMTSRDPNVRGEAAVEGGTPAAVEGGAATTETAAGADGGGRLLWFRKRVSKGIDVQGLRHTLLQPRLAMTAAMAFFSIALTLNLTGVKLSSLRMSDLRPASLKRSMYEANAHVVRYYTNLRVVYELESRVHELQQTSGDDSANTPAATPLTTPTTEQPEKGMPGAQGKEPEPKQRVRPGTSRRESLVPERTALAQLCVDDAAGVPVSQTSAGLGLERLAGEQGGTA